MQNLVLNYISSPLKAQSFMETSNKAMFKKIKYRIKLYQITQVLKICKASQRMKLSPNLTCPQHFSLLQAFQVGKSAITSHYVIKIADFHISKMIGFRGDLLHSHTHRDVAVSGPRFWWPHLQGGELLPTTARAGSDTGSSLISKS